jgi:hypothetical protein
MLWWRDIQLLYVVTHPASPAGGPATMHCKEKGMKHREEHD